MSYFKHFPLVRYNIAGTENLSINITRKTSIPTRYKEDSAFYLKYKVQSGETPEMIADRFYDDSNVSWVILMFNDIVNYFEEWPVDYEILLEFTQSKYNDINGIHHYISASSGTEVTAEWADYDLVPITNFEYEQLINEKKREIKVPVPEIITAITNQHNDLISRV